MALASFDDMKEWLGIEKEAEEIVEKFNISSASQDIVVVPDTDSIEDVDVRYPLIEPFAEAHIVWEEDQEELIYHIDEPDMSEKDQQVFDRIRGALEQKIDVPLEELNTTQKVVEYLGKKVSDVVLELGLDLSDEQMMKIMYYIYRNFAGLNQVEPLMHDPYIEDIGCSGVDIPIYIVHNKFGSIQTDMKFEETEPLKNLVVKLAERCGKYVSYASPLLDGALPDGSRVNASLTQDVTTKGPTFSIRKFQDTPYSALELIDMGTATFKTMAYFWLAMQYQKSVLIAGGTATGKTTFLNAIVTFIPPEQKIVSIEDTRELKLPHENWIPSVARTSFGGQEESEQDIDMFQLLKESFRQNPDYVVVGEVRGEEASVLFQGMSSGHPSIGTIHASSPRAVIKRLTTPPINLSPSLVESLDIIAINTRARQYGESARRLKDVHEIEAVTPEGSPRTNNYISWTPIDDTFSFKDDSAVIDQVRQQFGMSRDDIEQEMQDRVDVLKWMYNNDHKGFHDVARIVSEYYKDKESVMEGIREDKSLKDLLVENDESIEEEEEHEDGSTDEEDNEDDAVVEDPFEEPVTVSGNPFEG